MRTFGYLLVAAAALASLTADEAQAGGRRTRYYSYRSSVSAPVQRSTTQAVQPGTRSSTVQANAAQSNTVRRYSYSPAGSNTGYSYSSANRSRVMGSTPYATQFYWRADRKVMGY